MAQLPYNILRYAEARNPQLKNMIEIGGLDIFATKPGYTFLIPPKAVLTKILDVIKKSKADKCSADWIKVTMPLRKYILKGQLHHEHIRAHHHYISLAQKDYLIYDADGKIFLHPKEVSTAEIKQGIMLKLVTYTCTAQSVFEIPNEIPEGAEVKTPTKRRGRAHLIPCTTCEIIGGSDPNAINRYDAFMDLKEKFGQNVGKFIVGTLMDHLRRDEIAYKTCRALLTGNERVDSLILLEPMAESPMHEPHREQNYLVSDAYVTAWYDAVESSPDKIDWENLFDEFINELDLSDIEPNFFKMRTEFRKSRRAVYSTATDRAKTYAEDYKELMKIYQQVAKNAFPSDISKYLHQRFGDALPAYLYWKDHLTASYELMPDLSYYNWLQYREYANPGRDFQREFQVNSTNVSDFGPSLVTDAIRLGIMPYLRASYSDAFAEPEESDTMLIHPLIYQYRAELRKKTKKKPKPKPKSKPKPKRKKMMAKKPKPKSKKPPLLESSTIAKLI